MRFAHILCPVDFSEDSREAMRTAMAMAGAEARVTLVHVYVLPAIVSPDLPMDPTLIEDSLRSAEKDLRDWAAEAARLGPARVEPVCVQGNAWSAIVDAARERRADLIVMGTHGRTGLRHALLGSVAERVLRHAHCPVLVVRGPRP
jgi:nucleotide-binding universal stress UspA family protein